MKKPHPSCSRWSRSPSPITFCTLPPTVAQGFVTPAALIVALSNEMGTIRLVIELRRAVPLSCPHIPVQVGVKRQGLHKPEK